MNIPPDPQIF